MLGLYGIILLHFHMHKVNAQDGTSIATDPEQTLHSLDSAVNIVREKMVCVSKVHNYILSQISL